MTRPSESTRCEQCKPEFLNNHIRYYVCVNPNSRFFQRRVSDRIRRTCADRGVALTLAHQIPRSRQYTTTVRDVDPPSETPGIARRVITYAEALIEWTAAGRPERSNEEVQSIFANFCEQCKRFDSTRHICLDCGCRVANRGLAILNKIKMATQHCPKGKW